MQELNQKPRTALVNGLVTETSELTFPENATVDELNCDLFRDSSRRKRLGLVYPTSDASGLPSYTVTKGDLVHLDEWTNVGGQAGVDYLVVQIGGTLRFYDKSSTPVTDGYVTHTIDLTTHEHSGATGAETQPVQVASLRGRLIVVSSEIDPFYVTYNISGDSYTETTITPRIRDFTWRGDKTSYNEQLTPTVSDNSIYDVHNNGWPSAQITTYQATHASDYPPLTHRWFSGKDSSNNFSVAEFEKVWGGNTVLEGGRFILELFDRDYAAVCNAAESTSLTITAEEEDHRFQAVASFAGRCWMAGLRDSDFGSTVFYSKVVEDVSELGDFYQVNDPTSEELSDLLDSDGGYINIPDCYNIKKLHVANSSMLVFAENGVWEIRGIDGAFKATEYEVRRVTDRGLEHLASFVSVETIPFWWSSSGIHALNSDGVSGRFVEENISLNTIQTRWDAIGKKQFVKGAYDKENRKIVWMYPNDTETIDYKLNQCLWLDLELKAFYPWLIEDAGTSTHYAMGPFFQRDQGIKVLGIRGLSTRVDVASFSSSAFSDWYASTSYDSYFEAGYDFMGDMTVFKNGVYVTVYMKTTEERYTGNDTIGYRLIRPSSLKLSTFWDFKTSSSSAEQECYRLKHLPTVDSSSLSTFDYPKTVISTRLRIKGRGRSLKIRFENEGKTDFHFLGYELVFGRNGRL